MDSLTEAVNATLASIPLVASIPILFFILWVYTAFMSGRFPVPSRSRILLLIAHPDDEAMFFSPTIQSLIRPELENQVKILCLSSGNADGLGQVRIKELKKSAAILGLTKDDDVIITDDPNLPDGPKRWDTQYLGRLLLNTFAPNLSRTPSSKPPTTLIDTIITFDESGVSSHPNHISCYEGAVAFLSELMKGREGWGSPVDVYALRSVNTFRKYMHMGDALPTIILNIARMFAPTWTRTAANAKKGRITERNGSPAQLVFVSSLFQWTRAQRAMVSGHWSQMVWFRWGWIGIGRYLLINDLRRVKPA